MRCSMPDNGVKYYILFANYEQGLKLHDILDNGGVSNRIAPAPRSIQGELSCGMSLLIEPEHIDAAKACIEKSRAQYYAIVPLEGQIRAHRDRYC